MKRIITILVIFTVISGALHAQDQSQDQEPDFFSQQFDAQSTVQGKLGVVRNAEGEASTEFYAHALDVLVREYYNVAGSIETRAADDMAQLLAAKLGEAQYTDAGPNLWRLVENFTNPLVRAEALSSLGKIQAVDFIPQVVQLLSDYNLESGEDPMTREQVVFGAITALEAYKDSSGYLPVFFVTTNWYSERIKSRAREALPQIMDNPTEPLLSVIKSSSYNYAVKLTALQTMEASEVTTQQKAQAAVAALSEAWRTNTNTGTQRSTLIATRKLSLSMIRRYGTEDTNVYPLLERCYREGSDEEEQISAIAALSALATDDSARRLSSFLNDMNTRLARGTLTQEDERLVRVIIPALGNTGRPLARNSLRAVLQADWTGAVQRLAQDALKKIQ
jgi:HEAT repeat protein